MQTIQTTKTLDKSAEKIISFTSPDQAEDSCIVSINEKKELDFVSVETTTK